MTARPGGRAVKPGLERRFFAACAAASPLSFGGNKTNLAVEIEPAGRHPSPDMDAVIPPVLIQSLLRRVTLCFPAVLQALPPLHEDPRGRGGTALLSLSVPFACATRPQRLPNPCHSGRRAPTCPRELQRKKFWFLPAFALAHLAGFARKGSAPLRCGRCSLKRKNPGPSKIFPLQRAASLVADGGQRGRDWRSLTKKRKHTMSTNTPDFIVYGVTQRRARKTS